MANHSVYSSTKFAVRSLSEGLREEEGDKLRMTIISPGVRDTNFVHDGVTEGETKAQSVASRGAFATSPDEISRAVAYAIEQPDDVNVSEIIVCSTALRSDDAK